MREFALTGAVSESGRQVPILRARPRTVPDTTLNRIRCPAFTRVFPKNRCEHAASGISPGTKKFFCKNVFHTKATPLMGQNQILPRFRGRDMKQFLNFTLPPTGGFHHGGVSLWPCSSRRKVTRHGRQPGGGECIRGRF